MRSILSFLITAKKQQARCFIILRCSGTIWHVLKKRHINASSVLYASETINGKRTCSNSNALHTQDRDTSCLQIIHLSELNASRLLRHRPQGIAKLFGREDSRKWHLVLGVRRIRSTRLMSLCIKRTFDLSSRAAKHLAQNQDHTVPKHALQVYTIALPFLLLSRTVPGLLLHLQGHLCQQPFQVTNSSSSSRLRLSCWASRGKSRVIRESALLIEYHTSEPSPSKQRRRLQ